MAGSTLTNMIPGLLAGADLSSSQYRVVKLASTAGEVVACNATTDAALGILQNDPADGEVARIASAGSIAKAEAGTSGISAGHYLGFDTTARVVNHTTDNRRVIAQALEGAGATGDYIRVLVLASARY